MRERRALTLNEPFTYQRTHYPTRTVEMVTKPLREFIGFRGQVHHRDSFELVNSWNRPGGNWHYYTEDLINFLHIDTAV
jgi:hypothetical protein